MTGTLHLSTPTAEPTGIERSKVAMLERYLRRARRILGSTPSKIADDIDAYFSGNALTTPPTPDRIGKDAVREALEDAFCAGWDARHDGQNYYESRDNYVTRALSATPAQEGEVASVHRITRAAAERYSLDIPTLEHFGLLADSLSPAQPVDETERLRAWPAALTQGLREILGIPNFQCGPMAHAYQKIGEFSGADGLALENRAEDEQAFILHKLLCFWFEHGDGWREPAIDEIDRAAKAARALQHKGGVSRG